MPPKPLARFEFVEIVTLLAGPADSGPVTHRWSGRLPSLRAAAASTRRSRTSASPPLPAAAAVDRSSGVLPVPLSVAGQQCNDLKELPHVVVTGAEALTRLRLDGLRTGLEHLAVRRVDGPDVVPLAQMAAAASAPPGRARVARYAEGTADDDGGARRRLCILGLL